MSENVTALRAELVALLVGRLKKNRHFRDYRDAIIRGVARKTVNELMESLERQRALALTNPKPKV